MFEAIPRLIFTHTPDESTIEMSRVMDGICMSMEAFLLLTLWAWWSHRSLSILCGSLKLSPRFLKSSETVFSRWWWDFLSQAVCLVTSSFCVCCIQQSLTAVRTIDLLLLCGYWSILNCRHLIEMQHTEGVLRNVGVPQHWRQHAALLALFCTSRLSLPTCLISHFSFFVDSQKKLPNSTVFLFPF